MIKPDKIPFAEIRKKADDYRVKWCDGTLPIPIEEIIEFDLGIEIRPISYMKSSTDLDAVISSDLKIVFVEKSLMENHRYLFRYRFSLAHEIGHLILHGNKLKELKFESLEEWVKIRASFDEDDLIWFENQAMEFGGRLMVPYELLYNDVFKFKDKIQKYFDSYPDAGYETITSFVAPHLNRKYEVSEEVIQRRIINESILKQLEF